MMRLPYFTYHAPRTVQEAAALLADGDAMILAGGTDLLPNMKRRQQVPGTLVGLRNIAALRETMNGDGLTIGSGVTLAEIVRDARMQGPYGGLWQAAAQSRHRISHMGDRRNLCLDTACTTTTRTTLAQSSCLHEEDGETCWVRRRARSASLFRNRHAPALLALGASVTSQRPAGTPIPIGDSLALRLHYLPAATILKRCRSRLDGCLITYGSSKAGAFVSRARCSRDQARSERHSESSRHSPRRHGRAARGPIPRPHSWVIR